MSAWIPERVASPVEGEGVVMGRRKLFGYGGRWHVWRIRRRINRAGGIEALARRFGTHKARHAASERIDA